MSRTFLNVTSDIGKLKAVLLHRPGKEIENLVPEYLERLLFDDIPYLKIAVEEHDAFARVLGDNGAAVYYIEEMLAEVLKDTRIKECFINDFLDESNIISSSLKNALFEYLVQLEGKALADTLIAGVRKKEVPQIKNQSLSELVVDKYQFYLDPMPNLYFTRDIGAVLGCGLTINRMKTEARKRESLLLKYIYEHHEIFKDVYAPLWYTRDMAYPIEGGDQIVLNREAIAIGCSERTSPEAIELAARNIFKGSPFKKVLVFDIPKCRAFMHLDTVFTMVDIDKFTIHPGIENPMNLYIITPAASGQIDISYQTNTLEKILKKELTLNEVDLIRCGGGDPIVAAREQWNDGSNTLAIAPGVVITYERNYVSNELLESHNIKVISIRSSEISRGRGGPRCMSMPLVRDDIN
ncbi:arginine deiminase [Oxobacter pfennigii]|uniref:Arginine deiminase n=1 Tax=Oxobacter pfennigii TaxID=36849 RepID=A0A0P8YBT9_9CLOT|nr:arginine deiminase [Oxobacter pfennigii]